MRGTMQVCVCGQKIGAFQVGTEAGSAWGGKGHANCRVAGALRLIRAMTVSIAAATVAEALALDERGQGIADPADEKSAPKLFTSHFEQDLAFAITERQCRDHGVGERHRRI